MKVRKFKSLLHIGSLPTDTPLVYAPDRFGNGAHYEGIGLSVTTEPDEWQRIGVPGDIVAVSKLDRKPGAFLDWHNDKKSVKLAWRWAVDEGWAYYDTAWDVVYSDEYGERNMRFYSKKDAETEVEYSDGQGLRIVPREALRPTKKLSSRWASLFNNDYIFVEEEAVNLWIAAIHPELDGVWWEDIIDHDLSAPRGNILPHALPRWIARSV